MEFMARKRHRFLSISPGTTQHLVRVCFQQASGHSAWLLSAQWGEKEEKGE